MSPWIIGKWAPAVAASDRGATWWLEYRWGPGRDDVDVRIASAHPARTTAIGLSVDTPRPGKLIA